MTEHTGVRWEDQPIGPYTDYYPRSPSRPLKRKSAPRALTEPPPNSHVVRLEVPYIHQLWDTPDDFNGLWACGPTSCAMILAYYGALQPKPILVTEPYPHESGYGWYVSNAFTLGDTLLATFAQTPGHGVAAGLYGAVVGQSTDGTWLSFAHLAGNRGIVPTMSNALRDRGIAISLIAEPKVPRSRFMVQQAAEGAMKAALDSGHPLIVSGFLRFNGPAYNHLLVVCGYYVDNESFYWIVNDPFGFETDRSFDGHAIVYSTSEISPKYLYRFSEE